MGMLLMMLAGWINRHQQDGLAVASCPDAPLLVSAKGGRVIYRSIYEKIKKLGRQAGIGKLHPHMLRHTYGTRLYNVEQDLRFVQDQLGHASPNTTAIYAKTNARARRRQLEVLDAELGGLSG